MVGSSDPYATFTGRGPFCWGPRLRSEVGVGCHQYQSEASLGRASEDWVAELAEDRRILRGSGVGIGIGVYSQ